MNVGALMFLADYSIDVAVLAKRAEDLGYTSLWVPEHGIIPVNTTSPFPGSPDGVIPKVYYDCVDPFIALARASAVTYDLKLGTGICLVPERNPILLAKEVATLDHYSGGRFMFGIGAGWLKEESEILGGDFSHRWSQTREAILAMKELWTKDQAEYHGTYYDFPPVYSNPKPVQKPHPPVILGGKAKNVFKRVVQYGDGWMPNRTTPDEIQEGRATIRDLAVKEGRDPDSIKTLVYGTPGDRELMKAFEEAGADECIVRLDTAPEKEALSQLEHIALAVLN